jgi:hypothetical protein
MGGEMAVLSDGAPKSDKACEVDAAVTLISVKGTFF